MLEMREYVNIKDYTTIQVGGQFRYFIEVNDVSLLVDIFNFAKSKNLPILILGGGSNMVFPDGVLESVTIKINFLGFEVVNETGEYVDIKVGAGENWDSIVKKTVDMNLSGIEAMSAIPGTVGATPVQNVGAYGQEVKDTIISVEVFDINEGVFKSLSNALCKFGYRDSIFKNEAKGKYVITAVIYRLSKINHKVPNYPDVEKYFHDKGISNPTLLQIREAIIEIRKSKLPNPKDNPNAGSFFKNPIVENIVVEKLKEQYPNIKSFTADDDHMKVPAGWLIENAGLKGKSFGSISVYDKNALVLVNNGNATKDDLMRAQNEIIKIVFDKFGITLEHEPEFV